MLRLWLLFILFLSIPAQAIQVEGIDDQVRDSLSSIVRFSKDDTLRAQAFLGLGRMHHGSAPSRAQYFYERAKDVSEMGLYGNPSKEERLSYLSSLSSAMNNLSFIYRSKGDVKKELEYSFGALKIKQYLGNEQMIARSLYSISATFETLRDTARSLDYLQRAVYFFHKAEDEQGLSYSYFKLGRLYMETGDTSNGLQYYNQSLEIETRTNDEYGKATTMNALSRYYAEVGNLGKAFKMSREALRIHQELDNQTGLLTSLYNLGWIEMQRSNYTAANRYVRRGLEKAKEIEYLGDIEEGALMMSQICEAQGEYKKAYSYYEEYIVIHDSLQRNETKKDLVQLGIQKDFERQHELDKIQNEKVLKLEKEEASNRELISWITIGVLLIIFILSIFAYSRFTLTRQQKGIIESQNKKIVESINYAHEIQESMFPRIKKLRERFTDIFLVHESKQIVSGDFAWYRPFDEYSVLVCVDCKGQGVAGGFMSTVGTLLLDKIVREDSRDPGEIVQLLRQEFNAIIHKQSPDEFEAVDISVCLIYHEERVIDFAGIKNGITIISDGQGLHYPTGFKREEAEDDSDIKQKRIELGVADWVFLYTDGFINQKGGKSGSSLGYERFEEMLQESIEISNPKDKVGILLSKLDDWEDENERQDDALIIGFQV